jgi:hypothetical protein
VREREKFIISLSIALSLSLFLTIFIQILSFCARARFGLSLSSDCLHFFFNVLIDGGSERTASPKKKKKQERKLFSRLWCDFFHFSASVARRPKSGRLQKVKKILLSSCGVQKRSVPRGGLAPEKKVRSQFRAKLGSVFYSSPFLARARSQLGTNPFLQPTRSCTRCQGPVFRSRSPHRRSKFGPRVNLSTSPVGWKRWAATGTRSQATPHLWPRAG